MHELSLIADLIRKVVSIAHQAGGGQVTRVTVKLGALCHLSAAHLQEHFTHAARGTVAEGAILEAVVLHDTTDSSAQELVLESIDVETDS